MLAAPRRLLLLRRRRRARSRMRLRAIAARHDVAARCISSTPALDGRLTPDRSSTVMGGDRGGAVGVHVRPAAHAAQLPDAAAPGGRSGAADPSRVLRLALTCSTSIRLQKNPASLARSSQERRPAGTGLPHRHAGRRVLGDLEGQMVVVGGLLHHRDVVGALRGERQLRADALGLAAAGSLDD